MQVGERVRETIKGQGRHQSWVAENMGISQAYLTRLMNGQRPWLPHLRDAASRVLNVPESVLFLVSDCRESDDNGQSATETATE